jgi:hypothetical protein
MAVGLGLLVLSAQTPVGAAEPQVSASTSTRAPRGDIPLSLTFIQNRQDRRLELGYSLRWDFDDLKDAGPGVFQALSNSASVWKEQSWDIRNRTRFIFYGVRVDPWKVFFEPEPTVLVSSGSAAGSGAAGAAAPRSRFHASVWPMIKDINDHIEDDIRNEALRESLRRLPAEAQHKTVEDEQELLRDLVRWQREVELPGLSGVADGLDYLAPERPRGGARRDDVHFSTGSARGKP